MRNPNRYATILRLRKQAEDRQAQIVAAVRQEVQRAQRQRTSLELTRRAALEHAGTTLRERFDAEDVRGYYQYERHLAGLRDEKDAEIRDLQRQEADQIAILEQATQGRRVAEKLHERRVEAYRAHLRKEEQRYVDETATMYAARSTTPGRLPTNRGTK